MSPAERAARKILFQSGRDRSGFSPGILHTKELRSDHEAAQEEARHTTEQNMRIARIKAGGN